MSTLVARLRAEVGEDANEPLDRLLGEAADRVDALEQLIEAALNLGPWISASLDDPEAGAAYLTDAHALLEALMVVDVP